MAEGMDAKLAELRAIDTTIRMFTQPQLKVDEGYLQQQIQKAKADKETAVDRASTTVEILQSNPKFAKALEELGVEVPTKISPRTGKSAFALAKNDADFLALLDHPSQAVRDLVSARLAVKSTIEESRMERLLSISQRHGRLPIALKFAAAHTQRWSGSEKLNPQNLTPALKKALYIPKDEGVLLEIDYSQIEARVLAWLACPQDTEDAFLGAFLRDEDVYKHTASFIYGIPVEEIASDSEERKRGKITTLAAGFGLSADALQRTFKIAGIEASRDDAVRCIQAYRKNYPSVPRLWEDGDACLKALWHNMGRSTHAGWRVARFGHRPEAFRFEGLGFLLPNGTKLKYPGLSRDYRGSFSYHMKADGVRIFGAKIVENACQSLARQILAYAVAQLSKDPKLKIVLTVHDSILAVAPREGLEQTIQDIEGTMKLGPNWSRGLPLQCETKSGQCYGELT